MKGDIVRIENGSVIKLEKFKTIQADLVEQGYRLAHAEKSDAFDCPKCASSVGIDMDYSRSGDERGFVVCLSCWHVTKLIYVKNVGNGA